MSTSTQERYISEAWFTNLQTMRLAAQNGDLCVMSAFDAASMEPIALLAAVSPGTYDVSITPFAALEGADFLDSAGRLTAHATQVFDAVRSDLANSDVRASFEKMEDDCMRVRLSDIAFVMAANPYERFMLSPQKPEVAAGVSSDISPSIQEL